MRIFQIAFLCLLVPVQAGCFDDKVVASETEPEDEKDAVETTDSESSDCGGGDQMVPCTGADADSDTDTDADSDTGSDTGTDPQDCVAMPYDIELQDINMLILLDRSLSMSMYTFEGQTYEEIVDEALTSVVTDSANELVNFGLAVFPSTSCPPEATSDAFAQCLPSDEILVEIGELNGQAIATHLSELDTCGGTPICQSLSWITQNYLSRLSAEQLAKPTFVMLATDGAPNCNGSLDIETCTSTIEGGEDPLHPVQCLDDVCSNAAAKTLYDMGVEVFVVGVGDDVGEGSAWQEVMSQLASSGSGGNRDYFAATDPEALSKTFTDIIAEATPCTFEVIWEEIEGEVKVTRGCNLVQAFERIGGSEENLDRFIGESGCGDQEGWFWQGLTEEPDWDTLLDQCTTIELCPATCQRLKYGEMEGVNFKFGCYKPPE